MTDYNFINIIIVKLNILKISQNNLILVGQSSNQDNKVAYIFGTDAIAVLNRTLKGCLL